LEVERITGNELKPLLEGTKEKLVVLFTATWCGYCCCLENEMKDSKLDFRVIAVDVSDEGDGAWDDYKIEVVPTALLFKGTTELGRKAASRSGLNVKSIKDLFASHA